MLAMSNETKIVYYIGDEQTPYMKKIDIPSNVITLADFKSAVNKPNYKYFFKAKYEDFGVVKEEITNDDSKLPLCDNVIIAWLVAPDVDTISQSSSVNIGNTSQQPMKKQSYQQNGRSFSPDGDSRSVASSRRGRMPKHRNVYDHYDSQSTISSTDASTLSYDSRDDTSEYSTYTDTTISSQNKPRQMRHRYRKRRPRLSYDTESTYSSSITDSSMSLNILTVKLQMEKYNFLGISIVGQSNEKGDGGIYIGSIMKGGAVAADGRIEPGDMLLQVNEISFENMSNEDAVRELRNIVHKPGPIQLTVAKCWDPNPGSSYFAVPKDEPVRPIDPAAWASHIRAVAGSSLRGGTPPYTGTHDTSSDNLTSSLPESERYDATLSVHTDMAVVVRCLKMPDSGLDVKTRMWLKITIPDAFIGSDLVDWLMQKVDGLAERRDARKYASSLLKMGYIRHTVNKITFSEQCYYVFGDYAGHNLLKDMGALSLGDSNSDRESDTLGPLPVHMPYADPGASTNHGYSSYSQFNSYQSPLGPPPKLGESENNGFNNAALNFQGGPAYGVPVDDRLSDADSISLHSAHSYSMAKRASSNASLNKKHLASFGGASGGGSGSDQASESRYSMKSNRSGAGSLGERAKSRSGSERGSDADQKQTSKGKAAPFESPLPPYQPSQRAPLPVAIPRPLNSVQPELSGSRQSFQRAMNNPCDYFVGHL